MSELDKIVPAMLKVQADLTNVPFDSKNDHFKNKYPSLAGVRDHITKVADKHDILVSQNLVTNAEGVGCETILSHSSGQQLRFGPLYLPASKHDPQGFGSCATYARRYALLAAFNVVGDEDDDANKGTEAYTARPTQAKSASPSAGRTRSDDEYKKAIAEAVLTGNRPALWEIHEELSEDEERYGRIGRALPKADGAIFKDTIRAMQAERREAHDRMLANGRAS